MLSFAAILGTLSLLLVALERKPQRPYAAMRQSPPLGALVGAGERGMPLPTPEQIAKAKLAVQQAKARLQAIESRQSEAERKLDTRRKIIMGGLLLDAATKDERYAKVVSALLARVERDNDRKAFDGWNLPTPQLPNGAVPTPAPALDGQAGG